MLRELVVDGGGLYGYFGEQGLPVGIQECLERFQPVVCSKMGQRRRIGDGVCSIAVGGA